MKTFLLLMSIGFVVFEGVSALTCPKGTDCDNVSNSCEKVVCKNRMDECASQGNKFYGCLRGRDCNKSDKGSIDCCITDGSAALTTSGNALDAAKKILPLVL
ncbi:hypothetical protein NDU88_001254 [Pleurodeles waltl]|uniref:Uncharacterized protein n=1 Tax=Pleurodeles waltl TaxID=8319 RepID=A0AAV7U9M3_PLEWA|nr:hypothetical protein NDU88_001254 [Pleurodeles waltl]